MVTTAGAVASAVLALLLVVAGGIKLVDPLPASGSLRRTSVVLSRWPAIRLERAVRTIGVVEIAVAAMSTLASGTGAVAGAALATGLCASFAILTKQARQQGASCGCWGSLSEGPIGAHEVITRLGLLTASMVALANVTLNGQDRPVPIRVAAIVLVLGGCGAAALLVAPRRRALTAVAAATIGVPVVPGSQRAVPRRIRHDTIAQVRADDRIASLLAAMPSGVHIDWVHARVTSPQQRGRIESNRLVAAPGVAGNLRIIAGPAGVLMAIGESSDAIFTLNGSNVRISRKATATDRMPSGAP